MFNNNFYADKLKQINVQRSILSNEEHDLLVNWKEHMDSFLKDKKYIIVNEKTYIMIDSMDSNVYKTKGLLVGNLNSSLCDYTIQGLIINSDKNIINQGFCDHKRINVADNVITCTELNFKSVLEKKCEELFNNSDYNVDYQYKYYTSYFKEYILKKYNTMFPKFAHCFIEKMENKLDEELPF
jgi:hypothetical protein